MRAFEWHKLSDGSRRDVLARPKRGSDPQVAAAVRRIFDEVEREGWEALRRWSLALDKHAPSVLNLTPVVIDAARAELEAADIAALDQAAANIVAFHEATKPQESIVNISPGVRCRRMWRPIDACGLYIPGGTAPLFSTLLMTAIPARVAGVRDRIVVTPPKADGGVQAIMIAAAAAAGIEELWLVGGAQSIAALTLGVGVRRADKLFGPGNAYVAEAKRYAASLPGGPAIDLPAGPSELMVIADSSANPRVVAADLLSQAEHDADAQVLLVALSQDIATAVEAELECQLRTLPRGAIARASLKHSRAILVADLGEAAQVANAFAPEHLSLQVADPLPYIDAITNAAAVFAGAYGAETFGDYITGPSHVLPTDGAARAWSGLSVAAFMKSVVVQEFSVEGARALGPMAARLARLEGLEAHARAAEARL
jgi:histidinol dehydrogenase